MARKQRKYQRKIWCSRRWFRRLLAIATRKNEISVYWISKVNHSNESKKLEIDDIEKRKEKYYNRYTLRRKYGKI